MSIWIDVPMWPRHGTVFAHLISDESLDELHAFASAVGLHPRSFDGDHYDVPHERFADVMAAGATSVAGGELVRKLVASGLRLRKRRSDRPVARVADLVLGDGTRADVDLIVSDRVIDRSTVFAGMVFLRDGDGRFALVHSTRRDVVLDRKASRKRLVAGGSLATGEHRPARGADLLGTEVPAGGLGTQRRWPHRVRHDPGGPSPEMAARPHRPSRDRRPVRAAAAGKVHQ